MHQMTQRSKLAVAVTAVLFAGAGTASADQLGLWDFREFTTNYVAAPGPYQNYASSSLGSVTTMVNVGAGALEADTTRDSTGASIGSFGLLVGAGNLASTSGSNVPPAPVSSTDYLGFTVTADQDGLVLGEFTFSLGTSAGANTNATSGDPPVDYTTLETNAQLFFSTNGGTTFSSIGPLLESIADNAANDGTFTGMNPFTVDLSSLSPLGLGESIEFRLGLSDNRGGGTTTMGHYFDNFALSGSPIPEPTSLGLLAVAGAGLLARRRRA